MKRNLLLKTMLLLCALVVGTSSSWADETFTHTFTKAELTNMMTSGQSLADDVSTSLTYTWSLTAKKTSGDAAIGNSDGNGRGIQIGTGSSTNACRTLTLSTSSISGSIKKIKVVGGLASSGSGKINVKVGGNDFDTEKDLVGSGSEAGTYTFDGDAEGNILITMTQPSTSKAMYLKSIEITYFDASAVEKPTFSPAGGIITEATTVTISAGVGCTVYYTTNGTTPTTSSASGTSVVIPASGTTTLKAIAVDGQGNESIVATAEYVYKDPTMLYEEKTSFGSKDTSGTLETLISYESNQGGAGSAPAIYNNGIRLYQKSGSNDYGGYVTMTAPAGYKITGFAITSTNTYATTVDYTVDRSVVVGDGEALAKSSEYAKDGLFNSSVSVFNLGSGSSGRLEIASIRVYYTPVVPVTISAAEYATYYNATQALDFSTTAISVYTATDNGTYVKLNEITSGKVPADTPVVLYKEGANGTAISVPVIASAETPAGTNHLHVSTGTDENKETMFVLAKKSGTVGFYKWAGSASLSAGKVYLRGLSTSSPSRDFLGFEETTTGIANLDVDINNNFDANAPMYNLAGQRVTKSYKGVVIVNGKKILNK